MPTHFPTDPARGPASLRAARRAAGICLLLALSFAATSASAGTITGTVRAQGAEPAAAGGGSGAYASRRYKFVERLDYDQLRDFVVSIDQAFPNATFTPPKEPAVIRQKDAMFVPHVLPVLLGTTVEWPNVDDIYHNVFCMAETKPFDLGLYNSETPPKRIVFDKAGQADVFCSIHTKMHCIVLVLTNPYFALTDEKGRFTLPNVPAGTYRLRAWHERVPGQTLTVTVPAEGEVAVDFTLGMAALPKY
jgi:plastocyanin